MRDGDARLDDPSTCTHRAPAAIPPFFVSAPSAPTASSSIARVLALIPTLAPRLASFAFAFAFAHTPPVALVYTRRARSRAYRPLSFPSLSSFLFCFGPPRVLIIRSFMASSAVDPHTCRGFRVLQFLSFAHALAIDSKLAQ
ncbi:hypothetical protein DFH09DRAFT_1330105 [Mycena vulgaris]|nr:hypothetical protein DFH09DRAFT_1330105 [Mycena vulgaris]